MEAIDPPVVTLNVTGRPEDAEALRSTVCPSCWSPMSVKGRVWGRFPITFIAKVRGVAAEKCESCGQDTVMVTLPVDTGSSRPLELTLITPALLVEYTKGKPDVENEPSNLSLIHI